ncbi:carbohydrate kinase protein [Pelomyxa schiedti]|nr:carbohydrate kinase protein [Pelomyxa schiedti]
MCQALMQWAPNLHALAIGPGLGRDPQMLSAIQPFFTEIKSSNIPLLFDGDGIHLLTLYPGIVVGYKKAVITPNVNEFKRLCACMNLAEDTPVHILAKRMGGVTIVQKGVVDKISNGEITVICEEEGSPRRCGGQGDILAGSMTTFLYWINKAHPEHAGVVAALAACTLTRTAARIAFTHHHRSTTTINILEHLEEALEQHFPCGL